MERKSVVKQKAQQMKIAGTRNSAVRRSKKLPRRDAVDSAGTSSCCSSSMITIKKRSAPPFFDSSAAAAGRSSLLLLLLLLLLLSTRTIQSDSLIIDGEEAEATSQACGDNERNEGGGPLSSSRNNPQQQNFEQHLGHDQPQQQQEHRRLLQQQEENGDAPSGAATAASFLGHALTYHPPPPDRSVIVSSTVHCVGENYRPDAWMYRSCQFRHLCWDSSSSSSTASNNNKGGGEFLLFASAEEVALLEQIERLSHPELVTISSISTSAAGDKDLSLGSIHDPSSTIAATAAAQNKNKWYPTVVTDPAQQMELLAQGYYQLPSDTVLFPIQPSTTTAVQVWDDLFAMYTVLSGFAWEDKKLAVLVSVDSTSNNSGSNGGARDTSYWNQLGSALGISVSGDDDENMPQLKIIAGDNNKRSNLVCAKYAAAGLGMIAATRQRTEGVVSSPREQILTHAVGRGGVYPGFRAFLLNKMNAGDFNEPSPDMVGIVVGSTVNGVRDQVVAAFQNLGEFRIQSLDPRTADVSEQAQFAATTKICIAEMADPSTVLIAATFLPHESILLVFENGKSDGVDERERRHVRDLLELMGHFRLHWLQSANDVAKIIVKESDALGLTLT